MNTVKKIIAFAVVIFITFRLIVISVSASFAAPFMAEETLKTLFIEALGASGSYSADDLEAWDYNDLKNEFEIQMKTNSNFKPKNAIPFLVFPDREDIPGTPEHEEKVMNDIRNLRKRNDEIIAEWFNNMVENGGDLYDFIHPTYNFPAFDIQGSGGAYVVDYYSKGYGHCAKDGYTVYCFEYAEVDSDLDHYVFHNLTSSKTYHLDGTLWIDHGLTSGFWNEYAHLKAELNPVKYGDWRLASDGSSVKTDDEAIPVIGEADGVQITPDMLNPDGTVTIGGTTYYPQDFIDFDKFKDPAITDLLQKILEAIDNMPVVAEQDKPIVDVDNIEVAVPEELSDFTVPIGIANVFPFCLPWDFVRGIKTLVAKPEVPVFKTEIDLTDFCGFDLGVIPFEVSFEKWEPAVVIIRWFFLLLFIITLIILTPKICKGAGA